VRIVHPLLAVRAGGKASFSGGPHAKLTARGEAAIGKALEFNIARFRAVFASFSAAESTSLTALLHRLRDGFAAFR
jgi:hypothetical protein